MTTPAIIDTNIVVAGLLTHRMDAPVAWILDGMLDATFPFVVSGALLAEYRDVLGRPRLCRAHGLDPREREILLTQIARNAIVLEPQSAPPAPDPGDQHLWGLLAAHEDTRLVTGDLRLVTDHGMSGRVWTAEQFANAVRKGRNVPAHRLQEQQATYVGSGVHRPSAPVPS